MSVGAAEREVLFGTPVLSHQMQYYLLSRSGCRVSGREFRMVFADLSKATFSSAVISLKTRGIISIEGDDVVLVPEKVSIPGMILDRCWKAMRIEQRFTVEAISRLTGYSATQVREAIRRLLAQDAIRVLRKKGKAPCIYQVVSDSVVRPSSRSSRQRGNKVRSAWNLARRLGSFSFLDLVEILNISPRYAKELIQTFKKADLLQEMGVLTDGHTKVYEVIDGSPEEPPFVKNRARLKKKGY